MRWRVADRLSGLSIRDAGLRFRAVRGWKDFRRDANRLNAKSSCKSKWVISTRLLIKSSNLILVRKIICKYVILHREMCNALHMGVQRKRVSLDRRSRSSCFADPRLSATRPFINIKSVIIPLFTAKVRQTGLQFSVASIADSRSRGSPIVDFLESTISANYQQTFGLSHAHKH